MVVQPAACICSGVPADGDIGQGEAVGGVVIVNPAAPVGPIAADGDAIESCRLFVMDAAAFICSGVAVVRDHHIGEGHGAVIENAGAVISDVSGHDNARSG